MEEPLTPEAPDAEGQDKPTGPEPRLFNQESRDAIEQAYQDFQAEAVQEESAPVEAPPAPEEKPADKAPVEEPAPAADEPRTTFKSLEDAEKSYLESRKKMQEATERAKRLERENEEMRKATEQVADYLRRQQMAQPPQPQAPRTPPVSKEELEAKFYEDPVGFVFSLTEAGRQAALREALDRTNKEREDYRRRMAVESFTNSTQKYFDETYADLKPIEPLVTHEIQQVWNDPDFIKPILEDRKRDVITKAKAVVDEATKRLKERLPQLAASFGGSPVAGEPTKERLTSGAPPVVPGGVSGHSVRPSPPPSGETNEEYIKSRLKRQDRMMTANWSR